MHMMDRERGSDMQGFGRTWQRYAAAVVLTVVALGLRIALLPALATGYPFITFFPMVVLVAFWLGARPAMLAVALSAMLSWLFVMSRDSNFAFGLSSLSASILFVAFSGLIVAVVGRLQRINRELERQREVNAALLAHREVLFRELQHRVGNNIQMIASLIALQEHRVSDPAARGALEEAGRRLGLVGRIHRQLYDPAGAQLSLAAYIDQIARDVIAASGRDTIEYAFETRSDTVLPAEKAIPTALIVAEALNNALEHGFAAPGSGKLAVAVEPQENGGVAVTIADDGAGLPAGFEPSTSDSLGLKIAHTLARSLGGRFSLAAAPVGRGTIARLEIPPAPTIPAAG
jgi:two-component sensor histidine kinase